MNIPYTYLAVLLVFTLLVGVVIGDRLAAGAGVRPGFDPGFGPGVVGSGPGRSGGCAGLASARLHACLHRYGRLSHRRVAAHSGGDTGEPWHHTEGSCGLAEGAE